MFRSEQKFPKSTAGHPEAYNRRSSRKCMVHLFSAALEESPTIMGYQGPRCLETSVWTPGNPCSLYRAPEGSRDPNMKFISPGTEYRDVLLSKTNKECC